MQYININEAENLLKKQDPVLGKIIVKQKLPERKLNTNYFESLCRSIVNQQISVKAGRAIYSRFEKITDIEIDNIINLSESDVKEIGLSKQKVTYIKDLATHFKQNPMIYSNLSELSDDDVIGQLTDIKGIGVWTAKMFLISSLGRPDVFAHDDVGLQRAISEIYDHEYPIKKDNLDTISIKWKPYRTIASLHLWKYLDNE